MPKDKTCGSGELIRGLAKEYLKQAPKTVIDIGFDKFRYVIINDFLRYLGIPIITGNEIQKGGEN